MRQGHSSSEVDRAVRSQTLKRSHCENYPTVAVTEIRKTNTPRFKHNSLWLSVFPSILLIVQGRPKGITQLLWVSIITIIHGDLWTQTQLNLEETLFPICAHEVSELGNHRRRPEDSSTRSCRVSWVCSAAFLDARGSQLGSVRWCQARSMSDLEAECLTFLFFTKKGLLETCVFKASARASVLFCFAFSWCQGSNPRPSTH